jgi:hypothetical protein
MFLRVVIWQAHFLEKKRDVESVMSAATKRHEHAWHCHRAGTSGKGTDDAAR